MSPKTRQARKPASHTRTDGLERNAGIRKPDDIDEAALLERYYIRVILQGVSHPIYFHADVLALPSGRTFYHLPVPRDGQINEMAVFCEQIIDGADDLRLYDQDGPVKDKKNDAPIEVSLNNADWAIFPVFEVHKGQRIRFDVDNLRTFPENMQASDIAANTGSQALSLFGVWLSAMYFAEGGNRGSGQQLTRIPPVRP